MTKKRPEMLKGLRYILTETQYIQHFINNPEKTKVNIQYLTHLIQKYIK